MLASNTLLFLSLIILSFSISFQLKMKVRAAPCLFVWSVLFTLLFVFIPLLSNIFVGYAKSVREFGKTDVLIYGGDIYLVYAIGVLVTAVFIAFFSTLRHNSSLKQGVLGNTSYAGILYRHVPQRLRFIYVMTGLFTVSGFGVFIAGTGMSIKDLVSASRFEWFLLGSGNTLLILLALYMLGVVAVFAFYDLKYSFPRKSLSLIVYGAAVLMIIFAGGRKWLLFIVSGAFAGYYDRLGRTFRLKPKALVGISLAVFVAISWQFGRSVDWANTYSVDDVIQEYVESLPELLAEGDTTYFYRASLDSIHLNKRQGVIYPFAVVRRVLLLPVPDEWTFGLKPKGLEFLFAEHMAADAVSRSGNLPPGLIGAFVLSFGWLGYIIALPLLTILPIWLLDRYLSKRSGWFRDTVFASFSVCALLFMRGSTAALYFGVFNVAVVMGFAWLHQFLSAARHQ